MRLTTGKTLVLCGALLIAVPPAIVYAICFYVTHFAPRADVWDLIGFGLAPLAILAMAAGFVLVVIGLVHLLTNRLKSRRG